MASIVPDVGLEYISEEVLDSHEVAVGAGTTSPSSSDTSMESEVYRSDPSNANCSVKDSSETGVIAVRISVAGGTEVPAGTDITEFGVFAPTGEMLYHEVRSATTVDSGDRIVFEFDLDYISA